MIYLAALVKQRGVAVGVVSVEPRTVRSTSEAAKVQIAFAPVFPGLPIVLMAQDMVGRPHLLRSQGSGRDPARRAVGHHHVAGIQLRQVSESDSDSRCIAVHLGLRRLTNTTRLP